MVLLAPPSLLIRLPLRERTLIWLRAAGYSATCCALNAFCDDDGKSLLTLLPMLAEAPVEIALAAVEGYDLCGF